MTDIEIENRKFYNHALNVMHHTGYMHPIWEAVGHATQWASLIQPGAESYYETAAQWYQAWVNDFRYSAYVLGIHI